MTGPFRPIPISTCAGGITSSYQMQSRFPLPLEYPRRKIRKTLAVMPNSIFPSIPSILQGNRPPQSERTRWVSLYLRETKHDPCYTHLSSCFNGPIKGEGRARKYRSQGWNGHITSSFYPLRICHLLLLDFLFGTLPFPICIFIAWKIRSSTGGWRLKIQWTG